MARQGIGIDFAGVYDLQDMFTNLGKEVYKQAVINALEQSKDFVNAEIKKAMDNSKYNFDDGKGYSRGKTRKGLSNVEKMDVEIRGDQAIAYAGVSFYEAPELWFTAHGGPSNPHSPITDKDLYNAVRVKGKVLEKVQEIQRDEFNKVIYEFLIEK